MTVAEKFLPPVNPLSSSHSDIWKVDYNATVAKEAAMGWEGLGYIFALNGGLFLFAFIWFQLFAKSTRFSLYNFRSSSILSTRKDTQFSLAMWFKLIWHTPIEGTEVEMELGPEGTFYLLFQVYTGRFLALLSVFAITVLVPLYLSLGGDSMDGRVVSAPKENRILAQNISSSTITSIHLNTSSIFEKPSNRTRWWSFAHATIRSIPNESPYLWIPVFSCYLFTIAFGILFKRLSHLSSIYSTGRSKQLSNYVTGSNVTVALPVTEGRNKKKCLPLLCGDPNAPHLVGMQPSELSARSIFVDRGVPMNLREDRMLFLLNEVFPGYIQDCSVVLNLSEYHTYHNKRIAEEASFEREKMLSEMELNGQKIPFMLRFFPGGMKFPIFSSFCSSGRQIFYQKETTLLQKIKALKESEKESLESIIRQNKGAGRAFIVFHTARYRARFVRRVRNRSIASILARFSDFSKPKLKKYVRELGLTRWHLVAAPEPDDIDWDSVSFPFVKRTALVLLINIMILLLLLLFTSPVAVTSAISSGTYNGAAQSLSQLVDTISGFVSSFSPNMAKMMVNYIPTLILVMINAVLLNVLMYAGRFQPIATDSAKERMILRSSAIYLIFNTLFVPSLAFVSIDAVLLYLRNDGQVLDMLGTLFLHNSGIFFVNYVLQRAFLGTAVSLLRLSEAVRFAWEKSRAITPAEHVEAVEAWPFFTGTQAAIQISMLTIVLTFSTVVPVILPIGALYMWMQHIVDKYSLLYVRPRIKGRGSIARTCTHATLSCLIIYQAAMAGFFIVRGTKLQSSCVLILLMFTYILSLWWYIRDKQRAYHRIAQHQREQQKREEIDRELIEASRQAGLKKNEKSFLLIGETTATFTDLENAKGNQQNAELYREPALRKRHFGVLNEYGTLHQRISD